MDDAGGPATQLDAVRGLVRQATQRLLGNTISVNDDEWHGPSRLPDWSRAHVATHIARHAEATARLVEWARTGERQDMYPSVEARNADIEAGSGRSGLELQIDLDTTAGRLGAAFDGLDAAKAWDAVVEMRGGLKVPARGLPLARLLELVIHHIDLDIGYGLGDIDAQSAEWLLEWVAFRMRNRDDFPKVHLTSDSGFSVTVGNVGDAIEVRGSSGNLLGWVMNRADASAVDGADGITIPGF